MYIILELNLDSIKLYALRGIKISILRLLRIYSLPWDMYQHDVNLKCGHMEYIKYIVSNNSLPEVNTYQFYHPPLHHIIAAI